MREADELDRLIAYWRSGEPQRRARRNRTTLPHYCAVCGKRIGVDMGDDMCSHCRFWSRRKDERLQHDKWTECRECGRRCKRQPDGLCGQCRNNRKRRKS